MSWTTSHKIPCLQDREINLGPFVVSVLDDLWIFYEASFPDSDDVSLELYIFKTNIHEWIKVDLEIPDNFPFWYDSCVSHRNNLYVTGSDLTLQSVIFELNSTTMEFTQLMIVPHTYTPTTRINMFHNNFMHVVYPMNDTNEYVVFDLDTKQVLSRTDLNHPFFTKDIDYELHNGQLHITGNYFNSKFTAVWNDRDFDLISAEHNVRKVDSKMKKCGMTFCENFMYNEYFDFESNSWKTEQYPKPFKGDDSDRLKSLIEINGTMYAVILQNDSAVLRIFDPMPALSDVCLLNIANELAPDNRVAEIKSIQNDLPTSLSERLDLLVDWRLKESAQQ